MEGAKGHVGIFRFSWRLFKELDRRRSGAQQTATYGTSSRLGVCLRLCAALLLSSVSCSCVLGAIAFCRRVTSRSRSSAHWLFLRTLSSSISPSQLSHTNDLLFNSTFIVDASKKITLCQTLSSIGHNTSSDVAYERGC